MAKPLLRHYTIKINLIFFIKQIVAYLKIDLINLKILTRLKPAQYFLLRPCMKYSYALLVNYFFNSCRFLKKKMWSEKAFSH